MSGNVSGITCYKQKYCKNTSKKYLTNETGWQTDRE